MSPPAPLKGKRVADLSQFIAGPVCGQLLADFGAEVVKVEPPGGDPTRALPGTSHGSLYFRAFNTSKASRVIDLRSAAGRAALERLLTESDALIVNFGAATLRRLDLTWESVHRRHPHLVMTAVTGYGLHDDRTCMDTIAQCESGYARLNADEDGTPRIAVGWPIDVFSGLYAGISTAMALCDTTRTGGILVEVSMLEAALAALCAPSVILALETGEVPAGRGNRDRAAAPAGVYRCRDGHCYIYAGLDKHWARLRPVVGGPDLPAAERFARAAELDALVERWTSTLAVTEVTARMAALGIPAGAALDPVAAVRQAMALREGGVAASTARGAAVPAFPVRFSGRRIARRPAPVLSGGAEPAGPPPIGGLPDGD